jgi:hypothetical protein
VEEEEEQMSYPMLMELRSWRQAISLQSLKGLSKISKVFGNIFFEVVKAIVEPNADCDNKISDRKFCFSLSIKEYPVKYVPCSRKPRNFHQFFGK